MRIKDLGEIGLIRRIAANVRSDSSVIKGIGDDTAVIKWTHDKHLLFTCDMLVEDVHFWFRGAKFLKKATPFQIGWKALGRNISDIAAMGGVPKYALVSIGLDPDLSVSFADGIFKGMNALAKKFKINLVGGDTVRSKRIVVDVSLIGEVEKDRLVLRSGAKVGDAIFVTGFLGGSIKAKHLDFMPRLNEAQALVKNFKISSMIDISDGLILDLSRVLDASSVGALIYEDLIPLSRGASSFDSAVTDGEDFELLFTMSHREAERLIKNNVSQFDVPVSLIGEITRKQRGYRLMGRDWKEKKVRWKGYTHF